MFPPRRHFRRSSNPRIPLVLPPAVVDAEHLLRAGQYAEAAGCFEALAREAQVRDRPIVAGNLYLQAARCYRELEHVDQAESLAKEALDLLLDARDWRRVRQVLPQVAAALERQGRAEEIERLRAACGDAFQGTQILAGEAGCLPARCPSCGGPVCAGEVAWASAASAECPYCGGAIRAEL